MSWDAIVVGAGHNGLAAAATLAKTGRRTLVLEARDEPGGLCAGEEFLPGYRHTGVHHDTDTVRPWVVEALRLDQHGLKTVARPPLLAPLPAGLEPAGGFVLGDGVEPAEAGAGWARWQALVSDVRPVLAELVDSPAPRLDHDAPLWPLVTKAFAIRRAGPALLRELMRIVPGSIEDALPDLLPDRRIRAAVALGALLGAFHGPRSPQSAGLVLLREALADRWVVGGPAALVAALEAAAKAGGAQLRCGASVRRIRVEGGKVRGVELADGESIDAPIVVCAVHPRRALLELVDARAVGPTLEDRARALRSRVTHCALHVALTRAPRWAGREGFERVRVAYDPNVLERAFDDAKHGRLPRSPGLDIVVPTVSDPSLAPAGHHVLSVQVFGVPYAPEGGWDGARDELVRRVLAELARLDPELPGAVAGAVLLDPPTVEARYGAPGGHVLHGEHALDQLWVLRPGFGLAGHATPIGGLALASAGTHPHGWVSGACGVLGARAAIEG